MQTFDNFTDLKSYNLLKTLAQHPLDLTQPGVLSPERVSKFKAEGAGFKFLYATERVDDEVVEELHKLAVEAKVLDKMERMQNGEVMNFIEGYASENRAALHTALRDFFDHPRATKAAVQAAELAKAEVEKIRLFEPEMEGFKNFILVGIGGSELGPKHIYLSLEAFIKGDKKVYFIGNIDPDDSAAILKDLDLSKTLVAIVSKSGTTIETVTNENLLRERYKAAGLDPKEYFLAVTGEGSPMDIKSIYKECFYFWDWVGGRYSGTSASGGLILTFGLGFDAYWSFLKGAHKMDQLALSSDLGENLPLLGALLEVWNRNFLGSATLAIIPYSRALSRLSAHVQQVEMESNGKHIDRFGKDVTFETAPVIWGEPATNAQHSFFQMIHQGTDVIPLEFIGFRETQANQDFIHKGSSSHDKLIANMLAQSVALATGQSNSNPNKVFAGNRPSHIIFGKVLNAEAAGALFAYFEHKVAFEGFIWNINSFDQEGVQLGKVLAEDFTRSIIERKNSKKASNALHEAYLSQLDLD